MNLPDLTHQELRPLLDKEEFIAATVVQINKDLQGLYHGTFELNITEEKNQLDDLIHSLIPILVELSKRQPEQLSQFIYRVDLAEKKFFDTIRSDAALNRLAFLIIEREALKVYLRQKFSGGI